MATWTHAQAAAETLGRPRTRRRARTRVRARSGIVWIVLSGILLTGVVFVNVAVLRLNLALDGANRERADLQAQVAAEQSQLSSDLASPRIQARAARAGLVYADPSQYGYIDLGKR